MFSGVTGNDVPLALASISATWNLVPTDVQAAARELAESRGTERALTALVGYLLTDADECLRTGDVGEAGYVLRQALYLPETAPVS